MGMRFAGAIPALTRALKGMFPAPKTGRDYMNYAIRYVPELLGAGLSAASLPGEDVGMGTRALAAGEELATSLGLSMAGSLIGRGVAGRRAMSQLRKSNFEVPEGTTRRQVVNEALEMGTTLGDSAILPLQFFAPRPFYNSQIEQYMAEQPRQQAAEEQEQQANTETMIAALLASGALGNTSMMALDVANPRRVLMDING